MNIAELPELLKPVRGHTFVCIRPNQMAVLSLANQRGSLSEALGSALGPRNFQRAIIFPTSFALPT